MTAPRPFVARMVVVVPTGALTDLATWARCWTEAGADGLALAGDPGDPAVAGLVTALRTVTHLPLEVVAPPTMEPRADWAASLAGGEVDCLLPGQPPEPAAAEALAAVGVAWAWPMAAGTAPADSQRLHARNAAEADGWEQGPEAAERSLTVGATGVPGAQAAAVDTLLIPGELLETEADPAAQLARWRR